MLKTFITTKLIQLVIFNYAPSQFDNSSSLIDNPSSLSVSLTQFLHRFIVWDNVYFFNLFHNNPEFEHEFVFSPGWVSFIRFIKLKFGTEGYYNGILVSLLVSNLLQLATSYILYYFTIKVFKNFGFFPNYKRISYLTGVYYLLSSGGIFLTAGYSENLASFLSISGLYLRELGLSYTLNTYQIRKWHWYLISGVFIGLSFSVRANCLLLGIVYLYDLYHFQVSPEGFLSIIGGMPLFLNLLISNYNLYKIFCPGREWCDSSIPSLFSYCQSAYWNNGFLSYWTPNNIPNFLLAFPLIAVNFLASIEFVTRYPVKLMIPYLILNMLTLAGGVFFWNVQILNRILNFNPIVFWYLGATNNQWVAKGLLLWTYFQSGLFGSFLPPA